MDTSEGEHYVTFSLDDGIQNNVSHEEICEPIDEECVLTENMTEVTMEEVSQEDLVETPMAVEIITENSEDGEEQGAFIYIKKEASQQFTTGDESMAVEALRQLGGMYCFEEKKIACPSCKNTFAPGELAKHQNSCSSTKHICTFCREKFERKIDLTNHMVCHQVDRPHACRTCGNLFKSKASLQAHMLEVHQVDRPHKCTVCGADFQRPSSLSNHMKIHSYVAGRALMQANHVVASIETVKEGQWTAVQIATDQGDIEGLAIQQDKIDSVQEYAVLPSGEVTQLTEYTTQNSMEDENLDNECEKTFIKIDLPGNKGHTCSICGVSFARAASLTMHVKTHPKGESVLPVECEYCDKQFQDANCLANHQSGCTKKIMKNSGSKEKWGKHACSDCGKTFTTKQKMFRHQWIHRKKTFSCEVCGSQFEKQPQLDAHRLSSHPAGTPFTCQECGKSFVSRQGLWEHGRTHAGSPAHFHCDVCSKTFSSRQGYLIHHRTHTGERPYGCKFCWKAFRDGGTLRKHERIHTGERPHVCPLCQKSFNQKVVLREHIRWVHAAGKNEPELAGPPFPCPLCEILTQDREELCAHIVKHSDQMIAEAKAKSNTVTVKVKSPPKKKIKMSEGKQKKAGQPKTAKTKTKTAKTKAQTVEERVVTAEEQQEALLSISDHIDPSAEPQDTYFIVKNEYDNEVCIKAYAKLSDVTQLQGSSRSINLITIANKSNESPEKSREENDGDVNNEANVNTMRLIPISTESGETVYIAEKQNNTLHLISKQNESLPVLALPNPDTDENFSNEISNMSNNESSIEININNLQSAPEESEEEHTETMIIEPVMIIKEEVSGNEQMTNESDSENESEEMVCGICGHEFGDKNVLMEHVKIHI
ncbi:zinc finger and SCAN domain-containing protein 2-like isoform X2 [Copidosoma floridanum]|uniref:zinc finger and SCAN domain-containing protein 2-like isoform X2 n=1 Tax=Copidosoma floridanum TaxID=29053 RepID=UPI0006C9C8CF|nr:zinc finger and SCAN domain-containing protein 2-like isoform X2 [Copidosoma floridanum]